ncbi:LLM class flavin-dependent oxidoreductase [Streptomyces sp. M19]
MSNGTKYGRRLLYNAFTHVTPSHLSHGQWRRREARSQLDFHLLDPWLELARTAERGRLDAIFFGDTAGVYDKYRGGWETVAREGMQFPGHDPLSIISALGHATEHLGFAVTSNVLEHPSPSPAVPRPSTTSPAGASPGTSSPDTWTTPPATTASTPWSATTTGTSGARSTPRSSTNSGRPAGGTTPCSPTRSSVSTPTRTGSGRSTTPAPLPGAGPAPRAALAAAHSGAVPGRCLTGRAGLRRPARRGHLPPGDHPATAARDIADLRTRLTAAGRRPDDLLFVVSLHPVIGSTEAEARAALAEFNEWASEDGYLAHMSGGMGLDLGEIDPERKLKDVRTEYVRGGIRALIDAAPDKDVTFADAIRERFHRPVAGTPEQIADEIESWAAAGVDGFNLVPVTTPGWFTHFVDHVVPVLRDRDLIQSEYAPGTLRESSSPGAEPTAARTSLPPPGPPHPPVGRPGGRLTPAGAPAAAALPRTSPSPYAPG